MNPEYPFQPQPQPTPPPAGPQPGGYPPAGQPLQQPGQPYQQAGYAYGGAPTPPSQPPHKHRSTVGKRWFVLTFVFLFTTLVVGGLSIWAVINYFDQKNNVDSKVNVEVAAAVREQREASEKAAEEREKEPNRDFVGPDDYGTLSFKYPKTWSAYEAKDASKGGTYEVYFSPGVIPPAALNQRYALRLTIQNEDYDKVVSSYQAKVTKGDLKSSAVSVGGENGTRLDGAFSEDIRGSAVIIKIRDKTATLRTDADTFMNDFNALIATISFVK